MRIIIMNLLTVDLNDALGDGLSHVVGGLDLEVAGHPAAHGGDRQGVEPVGVASDLDPKENNFGEGDEKARRNKCN